MPYRNLDAVVYHRNYRAKHRTARAEDQRGRRARHPEKIRAINRKYYAKNRVKCIAHQKKYNEANREKWIGRRRIRRQTDPHYKLRLNLSSRILLALKRNTKSASTMELIGCSIEQLREWLEAQFEPGMTWKNQGEWHIDHIRPCASFDLRDSTQQRECFNFTNLQPLWAEDNLRKGVRYV